MKEVIAVLLVVFLLLLAGCLMEKAGEKTSTAGVEADSGYDLADSDISFIEENDTVEIGEML